MGGLAKFVSHNHDRIHYRGVILIITNQLTHAFGVSIPADESFVDKWLTWFRR
jgi:hypothetical protein